MIDEGDVDDKRDDQAQKEKEKTTILESTWQKNVLLTQVRGTIKGTSRFPGIFTVSKSKPFDQPFNLLLPAAFDSNQLHIKYFLDFIFFFFVMNLNEIVGDCRARAIRSNS